MFKHWQVSVLKELVDNHGGIQEILQNGIDKRYRHMDCSVDESVLVSASKLYNKRLRLWSLKEGYDPRAGFFPGFTGEVTQWYNFEFICGPKDLFEDPDDVVIPDEGYGYYVRFIRPEQITDIFLVEVKGEDLDHIIVTEIMRKGTR